MRALLLSWRNVTVGIVHELWTTRERLSRQGARTALTLGQLSRGWDDYCDDVGIKKRTANRWLSKYDPDRKVKIELEVRVTPAIEHKPELDPDPKSPVVNDPVNFVVSANVRRRHLNPSQRAMLVLDIEKKIAQRKEEEKRQRAIAQKRTSKGAFEHQGVSKDARRYAEEAQNRADVEAGKLVGVSGVTITRANRIKREKPDAVLSLGIEEKIAQKKKEAMREMALKQEKDVDGLFVSVVPSFDGTRRKENKSAAETGKLIGVSATTVERAKRIKREKPEAVLSLDVLCIVDAGGVEKR